MKALEKLKENRHADVTAMAEALQEVLDQAKEQSNPSMQALNKWIAALGEAINNDDPATIKAVLKDAVPEFGSNAA